MGQPLAEHPSGPRASFVGRKEKLGLQQSVGRAWLLQSVAWGPKAGDPHLPRPQSCSPECGALCCPLVARARARPGNKQQPGDGKGTGAVGCFPY